MAKRIAIITGASSGLGRAYAQEIPDRIELDELWLIARRRDRLEELARKIDVQTQIMTLDVTKDGDLDALKHKLEEESPDVKMLINSAGMGKTVDIADTTATDTARMIDLNCRALALITAMTIPFMNSGAHVVQIASIAAFQPMPGFGVYAATKSFVESYSKALRVELAPKGIGVTCVCPYWVSDTEFISVASVESSDYGYRPLATKTSYVVDKSLNDIFHNRMLSTPGFMSTGERFMSKILPDGLIMFMLNKFRKIKHKN